MFAWHIIVHCGVDTRTEPQMKSIYFDNVLCYAHITHNTIPDIHNNAVVACTTKKESMKNSAECAENSTANKYLMMISS